MVVMFDLIEILAALLSLILILCAGLSLPKKHYLTALAFLILAILPLLWAGYFRLPVPQTLIWMGMNLCAIIFTWQGLAGFVLRSNNSNLLQMPMQFSRNIQNRFSVVTGLLFAVLIILTRL